MSKKYFNNKWRTIIEFLESHQCYNIHKWYSRELGWAYLTDKRNKRIRIDYNTPMENIQTLVTLINHQH